MCPSNILPVFFFFHVICLQIELKEYGSFYVRVFEFTFFLLQCLICWRYNTLYFLISDFVVFISKFLVDCLICNIFSLIIMFFSIFLNKQIIFIVAFKKYIVICKCGYLCCFWVSFYWLIFLLLIDLIFLGVFLMLDILNFTLFAAEFCCILLNSDRLCSGTVKLLRTSLIILKFGFKLRVGPE